MTAYRADAVARTRVVWSRPAAWPSPLGCSLSARLDAGDLNPSAHLLQWPVLPLVAFAFVLVGALPLWLAPRVPQ